MPLTLRVPHSLRSLQRVRVLTLPLDPFARIRIPTDSPFSICHFHISSGVRTASVPSYGLWRIIQHENPPKSYAALFRGILHYVNLGQTIVDKK
jgi:hypothetical protein